MNNNVEFGKLNFHVGYSSISLHANFVKKKNNMYNFWMYMKVHGLSNNSKNPILLKNVGAGIQVLCQDVRLRYIYTGCRRAKGATKKITFHTFNQRKKVYKYMITKCKRHTLMLKTFDA